MVGFCPPGEVIKHGDVKCILNEGMPTYRDPFTKGRLVIRFTVKFPEDGWITKEKIQQLEALLPAKQEVIIPDGADECELTKFDPRTRNRPGAGNQHPFGGHRFGEAYHSDDDDDGGMGGQRVQCASQ